MRGANSNDDNVSLFPFLAVLLCTMGALLVILVVLAQQARHAAAQAERGPADEPAASESPPATVEVPEADREMQQARHQELMALRDEATSRLSDARAKLRHIEDHIRRLHDDLAVLEREADQLKELQDVESADQAAAQEQLAELRAAIEEAEAELELARQDAAGRETSFAIVPYDGPNGTTRRPIYIECREDSVVLQPEGVRLSPADFLGPLGPGNPLASGVRSAVEFHTNANAEESVGEAQPYPLLLVRPGGIDMYYRARRALASWGASFGYELVDGDWDLEFPPANPNLANTQQMAVEMARVRQRELAAAAPSRFLAGGGGIGIGSGSAGYGSGDEGGWGDDRGESSRGGLSLYGNHRAGGAGPGGSPLAGDAASPGGGWRGDRGSGPGGPHGGPSTAAIDAEGNGTGSSSAADLPPVHPQAGPYATTSGDGAGRDSMSSAVGGTQADNEGGKPAHGGPSTGLSDEAREETLAQGEGSGAPMASGQRSATSTDTAGRGAAGPAAMGTAAAMAGTRPTARRGTPAGPSATSSGSSTGGAGASGGAAAADVYPIAAVHGRDWATRGAPPDAVPVERDIRVVVRGDQIAILPERGTRGQVLKLGEGPYRMAEQLVTALREHMSSWGTAGQGLYWRPVLVLRVGPEAQGVAATLARLLQDSGIEVK